MTQTGNVKILEPRITVAGILAVRGINRNGEVVFGDVDHNMIVIGAREALAYGISDVNQTSKIVSSIGVGTDGTLETESDTALTNPFITAIDNFEYPEYGKVQFNWTIGYSEANGMSIEEFGLLTQDGSLFARKTRSAITKESDLSLAGSWTLVF